jgi:hypothetical protein
VSVSTSGILVSGTVAVSGGGVTELASVTTGDSVDLIGFTGDIAGTAGRTPKLDVDEVGLFC